MTGFSHQLLRSVLGAWKNRQLGNQVDYGGVALAAKFGTGVAVMPGSRIDQHCVIGSYTYVGYFCHIGRAEVGRYVSVANNCSIGPGEHALGHLSTSSVFAESPYDELTKEPVRIGNDVWLGVDAIVRRGVTVGDGAVVGANSFVNEDVPPFAIVAGSPARLLRYRFPESVRTLLLAERWWDLEVIDARERLRELARRVAQLQDGP